METVASPDCSGRGTLVIHAFSASGSDSSGDLLLDRRFAYAAALRHEGDTVAAADLLRQILAQNPDWLAAWMALAAAAEESGDRTEARRAFAEAAARDATGRHGAALHLARLAGTRADMAPPLAYVAALFDGYAVRFDRHLVDGLGYCGPAVLCEALAAAQAPARFARALDLGCGTGLMGRAIRSMVLHLAGIDIAAAMVAEARRTGLYDQLDVLSIEAALAACAQGSLDLVIAADVLVYCGRLDPVCIAVARALAAGGTLAFTVQQGETGVTLGDDLRVAHGADHVRGAVAAAGLALAHLAPASTRRENGRAVPGLAVVARKP